MGRKAAGGCCVSAACQVYGRDGGSLQTFCCGQGLRGVRALSFFCTPFIVFHVFAALCLRWGPSTGQ